MAGPRIYWDAHNYLSMGLCTGPSPDDDDGSMTEEEHEVLSLSLKEKGLADGFSIDWFEDPERFAQALEEGAAWLRRVAAAQLPEDKFHIRTDID